MPKAYNGSQVTFALQAEAIYYEAFEFATFVARKWGYDSEAAQAAEDRRLRTEWLCDELGRVLPGATCCEHGMSLQLCYGPGHYTPDNW